MTPTKSDDLPAAVMGPAANPLHAVSVPDPRADLEGEFARTPVARAVQAATSLVEAYSVSGDRSASRVVLRFKIGAEDLAVRIALVRGQPTAEFQSRSAEVREAVLKEWQAVVPAASPLRAQEPVFTAEFSTASHGGDSQWQGGRSRGHAEREVRAHPVPFSGVATAEVSPPAEPVPAASSNLLSAFA